MQTPTITSEKGQADIGAVLFAPTGFLLQRTTQWDD